MRTWSFILSLLFLLYLTNCCWTGFDVSFSFIESLIVNSVPLFLFISSSQSSWSIREVISCIPRVSSTSISMSSGMPTPLIVYKNHRYYSNPGFPWRLPRLQNLKYTLYLNLSACKSSSEEIICKLFFILWWIFFLRAISTFTRASSACLSGDIYNIYACLYTTVCACEEVRGDATDKSWSILYVANKSWSIL